MERGYLSILKLLIWVGLLAVLFPVANIIAAEELTELVSVSSSGDQGNGFSEYPTISADGRFVAYFSYANNLVIGDTNLMGDVFIRDRQNSTTERVSVSSTGEQGNGGSQSPSLSADGRFIAFSSGASNLVGEDTNLMGDVFIRDRQNSTTQRVSVSSTAEQGNGWSGFPSLSANGRFIAFSSSASNLVTGDTNNKIDIFVRDCLDSTTERVSVSSSGEQGNGDNYFPFISADGRFVTFSSLASNLVNGDSNGGLDIFVHDRLTGTTERVSITSSGDQVIGLGSKSSISADGHFVSFDSWAGNLICGGLHGGNNVFVRDLVNGTTECVSVASSGIRGNAPSYSPMISADGRFISFESYADNLVNGDTNGQLDVFLHDRLSSTTALLSLSNSGEQGNGLSAASSISGDGQFITFHSNANNLVVGDIGGSRDIFVRRYQNLTSIFLPLIQR